MNKPSNFKQWRKVLHQTWANIGSEAHATIKYHAPRTTTKYLWKLSDRARRIQLQMEACADAFEAEYCEALIEAVFSRRVRDDEQ